MEEIFSHLSTVIWKEKNELKTHDRGTTRQGRMEKLNKKLNQ